MKFIIYFSSILLILGLSSSFASSEQSGNIKKNKTITAQKSTISSGKEDNKEDIDNEISSYQKVNLGIAALAAFSTFLAVFWVLFKDTVISYWNRPKFKCDLKIESPYITKTNLECSYLPKDKEKIKAGTLIEHVPGYYYHIRVLNSGRTISKNCVGYIEELHYLGDDNKYHKSTNFLALPLAWAHEGHLPTYINPNQEKFLDIGYISKKYIPVLYIPQDKIPRLGKKGDIVFRFCFNKFPYGEVSELWAGVYKIKVSVYSENTKSFSGYVRSKWTGKWNDDYEVMNKEIQLSLSKSLT